MALEAPLRSSTGSIPSGFSPHADMSFSSGPESPALPSQYMAYVLILVCPISPHQYVNINECSSSSGHDHQSLRPNSFVRPSSAHLMSPNSDIVGPSPVTSNGTETTEIEDDFGDEHAEDNPRHPSVRRNTHNALASMESGTDKFTPADDAKDQHTGPYSEIHKRRSRLRHSCSSQLSELGTRSRVQ